MDHLSIEIVTIRLYLEGGVPRPINRRHSTELPAKKTFVGHASEKEAPISLKLKKRVLAIDYGTKRIGLAQSDPLGLFAQPVGTFDRATLFKTLTVMLQHGDVDKIIVGYPLSETGLTNAMTGVIDRFIGELTVAFPDMPVERVDEHHSSRDAGRILVEAGGSRKKRQQKGRLDSAAACVLLREYLESPGR